MRYTPQTIDLETRFKPFIPEYIPAVGDIDAFIKVRLIRGNIRFAQKTGYRIVLKLRNDKLQYFLINYD